MMIKTLGPNGWNVEIPPNRVPYIAGQSAVPVILVPNGTVAANGTITLGTALPMIYSSGAWIRLPAGAVVGGAAGLYWCVFSTATVGVVQQSFIDPAIPFALSVPAPAPAAVGSDAAYTQTTAAEITVANFTIPGGAMGKSGRLRVAIFESFSANANAKGLNLRLGGTLFMSLGNPQAANSQMRFLVDLQNRGVENRQFSTNYVGIIQTSAGSMSTSVDTSTPSALTVSLNIAVATDYQVLEMIGIEILPGS